MAMNYVKKIKKLRFKVITSFFFNFKNPSQHQPNEKLYKCIYKHLFYFRRNLLTIAIFYGLPVVQLVYINQRVSMFAIFKYLSIVYFLCCYAFKNIFS